MYLAVPVLLYAGERTLRFFRSGFYSVRLLKVGMSMITMILDNNKINKTPQLKIWYHNEGCHSYIA